MTTCPTTAVPPAVVVAAAGVGVHAFNHVTVVVQDVWRFVETIEVRAELVCGYAVSAAVLAMLWAPASTRRYFAGR